MTKDEAFDAIYAAVDDWANCFEQDTDERKIRAFTWLTGYVEAMGTAVLIKQSKDEIIETVKEVIKREG